MPGHRIRRSSAFDPQGAGDPSSNSIRVDSSTETLKFGTGAVFGSAAANEKAAVDDTTAQTITGVKTFTGAVQEGALAGAAFGLASIIKKATALGDAAATDFDVACVVTVPNINLTGAVQVELVAGLGDQDSAEASYWTIAISRIAGAAAKAVVAAKGNAANTAGVTANAAGAITVVVAGGVGAVNTINIKVTVTHSAGASTTHDALARLTLMNVKVNGLTIA